jgi:hypothetical protein
MMVNSGTSRPPGVARAGWALAAALWGVGACDRGDTSADGADTDPGEPADGGSGGAGSDGAAADPGEPMNCEAPLGAGACGELTICDVVDCGGKTAPYNHFGCARIPCDSDSDCAASERCFAVALETACRAEIGACTDEAGTCACAGADSCGGVTDAHCLPTGFYPAADDCLVDALPCDELEARLGALESVISAFEATERTSLVPQLQACQARITDAHAACAPAVAP